jgi:hypothetical protein
MSIPCVTRIQSALRTALCIVFNVANLQKQTLFFYLRLQKYSPLAKPMGHKKTWPSKLFMYTGVNAVEAILIPPPLLVRPGLAFPL